VATIQAVAEIREGLTATQVVKDAVERYGRSVLGRRMADLLKVKLPGLGYDPPPPLGPGAARRRRSGSTGPAGSGPARRRGCETPQPAVSPGRVIAVDQDDLILGGGRIGRSLSLSEAPHAPTAGEPAPAG
jgi:hypothetical protein